MWRLNCYAVDKIKECETVFLFFQLFPSCNHQEKSVRGGEENISISLCDISFSARKNWGQLKHLIFFKSTAFSPFLIPSPSPFISVLSCWFPCHLSLSPQVISLLSSTFLEVFHSLLVTLHTPFLLLLI